MKNYRIAAICLLSAVSLAACSPAGTNVSFPNMIQVENGESQSTIEVSGRETVKIEPDKASITLSLIHIWSMVSDRELDEPSALHIVKT